MKSSPICILICRRLSAILPVSASCAGMSLHSSMVAAMSSSKSEVWCGACQLRTGEGGVKEVGDGDIP